MDLELDRDGAQHFRQLLDEAQLSSLWTLLPPTARAGVRLFQDPALSAWCSGEPIRSLVRPFLGKDARPVRAILFDKSSESNWTLGWHQDRTVAVREKATVAGFENWNTKCGVIHVEPPFAIIERMVTARIHLDSVPATNAPLLVAPGSHLLGRLDEKKVGQAIGRCGQYACLAEAGDVWLYRTAILHASERSANPATRRVLQVDFAAEYLPAPLQWAGLA